MRQALKKFLKAETGASAVEFVIVLPTLLLIFFSMIAWGYSMTVLDAMYDSARKTARLVSVGELTPANAPADAEDRLEAIWPTTFNAVASQMDVAGTDTVTVTVTTPNFFDALLPTFVPALPQLTATVTMRKEEEP